MNQSGGQVNYELSPSMFPSSEGRVCQSGGTSYALTGNSPAPLVGPNSGYGITSVNPFAPKVNPFPLEFKSLLGGGKTRRSNVRRSNVRRSNVRRSNVRRSNVRRSNVRRSNVRRSKYHVRKTLRGCMKRKRTMRRSMRSRSMGPQQIFRSPMMSGGGMKPLMPDNYADAPTLGYTLATHGGLSALANPMPIAAQSSCQ